MPAAADSPVPRYSERLWPGVSVWLLGGSMVVALGVAYGKSLGPVAGWLMLAASAAGLGFVVARMAARVEVGDAGLRAGQALLPWSAVGRVVALDGDGARRARGPQGDPSAYLLLRPGVGPGAVVVEVTDPQDPHHTWLVASRKPRELARAIEQGHGRLAP